jgi:hypothetical protein
MPPAGKLDRTQVEALEKWVAAGAIWPKTDASKPKGPLWSIQPIARTAPPKVRNTKWIVNPIDAFILSKLEKRGLSPAPRANRRTLIRRLYFDLVGLPPTPGEIAAFLADRSADAWPRLVDRLLASPRYGERWGRYWLDLVRYADTNGYERDAEKPYAWKYRDYVIDAFNSDMPYNRFVLEQLAGDELPNRNEKTLTATGFLRVGTWDDEPNDPLQYRYERLDDLVHAATTAFLGLTVRCARCHDHKFDAIPQRDYYAIANAFHNGYLDPGDRELQGGPPPSRLKAPVLGFTEPGSTAKPLRLLINGDPRREADIVPPGYLSMLSAVRREMVPPNPEADTTRRRTQLAQWITDPANPITSRVWVNRIWQHHFGEGLSRTPNNFGVKGALPSHPELLDWLAVQLTSAENGPAWTIKKLHRLILTSNTWQMSSQHPQHAAHAAIDAENTLLWRAHRRRLDADALRDGMLAVSGNLNLRMGGRGFVPTVAKEALEGLSRKGAEWQPSPPEEQNRRTVYMFLKRALIPPMLAVFDFPDTTQPLEARDVSLVAPQALTLLNNPFVRQQSEDLARRAQHLGGSDRHRQVVEAFRLALGRAPSAREMSLAMQHILRYQSKPSPSPKSSLGGLLTSAVLHLHPDVGVELDADGRVAAWRDASTGITFVQPDPSRRPTPADGRRGLHFNGASSLLLSDRLITSQQFTIAAVVTDASGSHAHREILSNWNRSGNIGTSVFLGLTGAASVRFTDHFASVDTLHNPSAPFILTAVSAEGETAVFQNRRELTRIAHSLPMRLLQGPWVIGQQGNIDGEYWKGEIRELLVFNRALNPHELETVWDALHLRWGLAARPRQAVPAHPALASLCHVLLNSNEFVYVD